MGPCRSGSHVSGSLSHQCGRFQQKISKATAFFWNQMPGCLYDVSLSAVYSSSVLYKTYPHKDGCVKMAPTIRVASAPAWARTTDKSTKVWRRLTSSMETDVVSGGVEIRGTINFMHAHDELVRRTLTFVV